MKIIMLALCAILLTVEPTQGRMPMFKTNEDGSLSAVIVFPTNNPAANYLGPAAKINRSWFLAKLEVRDWVNAIPLFMTEHWQRVAVAEGVLIFFFVFLRSYDRHKRRLSR